MALAHAMTSLSCICFLLQSSISLSCSQEDGGGGVEVIGGQACPELLQEDGGRRAWEDQTCPELQDRSNSRHSYWLCG